MPDRYFVESPIAGDVARLEGSEAHHLAHVMRARPGEEVTLFDGTGLEFSARVEKIGRATVELAVLARREGDRELTRGVTLAVSLPKGERQRWLVEKATELGAARLVPLVTTRGVAQPVAAAIARLRRAVIEASKQCGRNRLMEIGEPVAFRDYVRSPQGDAVCWIAHPSDAAGCENRRAVFADDRSVVFAVGPEGGFTDEEVRGALDAGWQPLDLGDRVLRVETAAIAVAAWVAMCAGGSAK